MKPGECDRPLHCMHCNAPQSRQQVLDAMKAVRGSSADAQRCTVTDVAGRLESSSGSAPR